MGAAWGRMPWCYGSDIRTPLDAENRPNRLSQSVPP